jgi:hypothetical protein
VVGGAHPLASVLCTAIGLNAQPQIALAAFAVFVGAFASVVWSFSRRGSQKDTRAKVLTNEGRRPLDPAEPAARSVDEPLLAVLPAAQRKPFLSTLQAIVRNLEAGR